MHLEKTRCRERSPKNPIASCGVFRVKQNPGKIQEEYSQFDKICIYCNKSFFNAVTMRRHMQCHYFNRDTFQCDQCNKVFLRKDCLKRHKSTVHMNEARV